MIPISRQGSAIIRMLRLNTRLRPKRSAKCAIRMPPKGPRQVTGDEDPEALQQAQPFGHFRREEQLAEGQREKYENDEIVDFQRPAQGRKAQGLVVRAAEWRRARIGVGSHEKNSGTGKNQGAHGLRKRACGQPVRPKSHSQKTAPQKTFA
jgi:hypothetical protein